MTPTTRLRTLAGTALAAVAASLTLGAGPAGASTAVPAVPTHVASGYWACVAVMNIDLGICIDNPF